MKIEVGTETVSGTVSVVGISYLHGTARVASSNVDTSDDGLVHWRLQESDLAGVDGGIYSLS